MNRFLLFVLVATMIRGPVWAEDISKIIVKPNVKTATMGGVPVPSADVLRQMSLNQYILRAAKGKLTRVAVRRIKLPHSNGTNPQVDQGPQGAIYVRQTQVLCKSVDGGLSWTARKILLPPGVSPGFKWRVLSDGTFVSVHCKVGKEVASPATVWASHDEGRTWQKRATIALSNLKLPNGKVYATRYTHRGLNRLRDDTLLWGIDLRADPYVDGFALYLFRSTDGGKTWSKPIFVSDRGASEGGSVLLPSGRVFATVRLGRWQLKRDNPLLAKFTRKIDSPPFNGRHRIKNLFVMDSADGGKTWSTARLLTTVFGQCFGYPAALGDGTVVVVHDTRYGPGPPGSRAMVSRDEGRTWLDEVYYLDYTRFTGSYSASITLKDKTILTICGSSMAGNSWAAVSNKTDFHAIKWKPVK